MDPKRKLNEILAKLPSRKVLDSRIQLLQPFSRHPQLYYLVALISIALIYYLPFSLLRSEDVIYT
jgi:hypothetical protein